MSMDTLRENFTRINHRPPSEGEFSALADAVVSMGISENDEFTLIFLVLEKMARETHEDNSKIVKKNLAAIKEYTEAFQVIADTNIEEYSERTKKLFATAVEANHRLAGETTEGLRKILEACKGAHMRFLNTLDEKLQKGLVEKTGEVISHASKTATTRLQWGIIGGTICVVLALFFGTFLYSAQYAYNKGVEAGKGVSASIEIASKYDPLTITKILQCEWPGWKKGETNGQMACLPALPSDGKPKGWYLPE